MMKSILLLALLALAACSSTTLPSPQNYDFGPLTSVATQPAQAPLGLTLNLADVSAPASLEGNEMLYRLLYDDAQQARPYAAHRWSMPPSQLLGQRLKARIAGAGGSVISSADGNMTFPVLKIELDEFSQWFRSPQDSSAHIDVRASVFRGRTLVAQHSFVQQASAASADAPGGAKAMRQASDELITQMLTWLQGLQLH
jgi:cholesterol transport system auxiliary component